MSTALAILPRLWACEATEAEAIELQPLPKTTWKRGPKAKVIDPGLAFYRRTTEGMLQRYMRLSLEIGRTPSLLGQEMFRGKVTSYRVYSFEDVIIFVQDVEKCIRRLTSAQQHLITRITLQGFSHNEVAAALQQPRRSVIRNYDEALDALTTLFLAGRMIEFGKDCQE